MSIVDRLHAVVHPHHDTAFDQRGSAAYDRRARSALRGLYRRVAAEVADVAPPSGTVLDVGTGPGRLLHEIAGRRDDLTLTGIDVSADMVAVAERAAAELARVLRPAGRLMIYDFRFARLGRAVAALNARPEFRPGGVRREPVRVRWYPVTPFARFTAATRR
jgi:ubiquinone/menaquinone biosynthesis C-methylase UbiE